MGALPVVRWKGGTQEVNPVRIVVTAHFWNQTMSRSRVAELYWASVRTGWISWFRPSTSITSSTILTVAKLQGPRGDNSKHPNRSGLAPDLTASRFWQEEERKKNTCNGCYWQPCGLVYITAGVSLILDTVGIMNRRKAEQTMVQPHCGITAGGECDSRALIVEAMAEAYYGNPGLKLTRGSGMSDTTRTRHWTESVKSTCRLVDDTA